MSKVSKAGKHAKQQFEYEKILRQHENSSSIVKGSVVIKSMYLSRVAMHVTLKIAVISGCELFYC